MLIFPPRLFYHIISAFYWFQKRINKTSTIQQDETNNQCPNTHAFITILKILNIKSFTFLEIYSENVKLTFLEVIWRFQIMNSFPITILRFLSPSVCKMLQLQCYTLYICM